MLQNDYPFWIFSKAISRRVTKILAYNGGVLNRHRPRAAEYLKLRIYLSTDKVFESLNSQTWLDFHYDIEWLRFQTGLFKCLIASMAGFLLWLSVTNIMIEVFKGASAQRILFHQWIWFILQWREKSRIAAGLRPGTWGLHYSSWDYIKYTSPMSLPACTMALGC